MTSFDGETMSGFLYRPDPAKFPGKRPADRQHPRRPRRRSRRPGFLRPQQLLSSTSSGVAIFYPNVRGSTGLRQALRHARQRPVQARGFGQGHRRLPDPPRGRPARRLRTASRSSPYPDGRRLLDAGVTVAIANDCNPGSSYTSSMPLCIALAVREMGLSPAEALTAATTGGARALGRNDVGHLGVGASADLAVLDAPSYLHLAYRPGVPLVRETYRRGRRL